MNHSSQLAALVLSLSLEAANSAAPYPRSTVITGIEFHHETLQRSAPGSDIWSCSSAPDGSIYAAWGDGGGFGGDDQKGRASIGVAQLTGVPPDWKGINLWGGFESASKQKPTTGKGTITVVGDMLYLYVSEQGKWDRCRLWRSGDHGLTWSDRGWIFSLSHKVFAFPGLVQFGAASQAKSEGYVYGFSDNDLKRGTDKHLYLFRVKRDQIESPDAYEYFSGTADSPSWSSDVADRKSVFHDPAGIGWGVTCVYHALTGRYLLAVTIHEEPGDWGLYESEHPWGPWRTVAYGSDIPEWTYSPAEKKRPAYLHTFPVNWMSADGKTLWCVSDRGDHFNVSKCTLNLK